MAKTRRSKPHTDNSFSFWHHILDCYETPEEKILLLRQRANRQQQVTARHHRQLAKKQDTLEEAVEANQERSAENQARIESLEDQVGTLQLMTRVMLAMLKESPDFDEAKFHKLLYEIDISDGKLDGKYAE